VRQETWGGDPGKSQKTGEKSDPRLARGRITKERKKDFSKNKEEWSGQGNGTSLAEKPKVSGLTETAPVSQTDTKTTKCSRKVERDRTAENERDSTKGKLDQGTEAKGRQCQNQKNQKEKTIDINSMTGKRKGSQKDKG